MHNNRKRTGRTALLMVSFLWLSACISHQQYRHDYHPCVSASPEADCQTSAIQVYQSPAAESQGYLLGFVEFDDQGHLWDRQQMRRVLDQFAEAGARRDLLMVVFAHGWKHSARAGDDNIDKFRATLRHLSAMETALSKQSGKPARQVAGVYLGWRGGSVSVPLLKELTFWDRKNTAHKVGYGGVTEVLSRLELLRITKHAVARRDQQESDTRLVVIGHSFGGAVVYSALSEILEHGFVHTQGPAGQVSNTVGFADLVVLINPAFEAIRYSSLSDMSTERGTYFVGQLPTLAVLTSEADRATRFAFPAGRWFSTLFEKERQVKRPNPVRRQPESIDEGKANITTIGHFEPYQTHYLRASEVLTDEQPARFDVATEVALFVAASDAWEQDRPGSRIVFNGSTLERSLSSAGRNPYLNIYVDGELISNHNDIYDPRIESFVRQLILIASQSRELADRQQLRNEVRKP
ncbi:esterase [Marinobacter sp. X15-166B]|uniref:esterase n=1 Tax=Marinobacter sp. X15-166B TaxID=1897620 RepID=UPI00085C96CD|nr:esterase [Marinobacter sp. X15-166B]OEY67665.1 esterase [Marinobacter sp. X15-166B]